MFHFLPRCIVISLVLWIFSFPAVCDSDRRFYIGSCQLPQDPDDDENFGNRPLFCIKGSSNIEGIVSTEADYPSHEIIDGYAYVGAYYSMLISLHGKINYRMMHFPPENRPPPKDYWQKRWFFLQLGNPVLTRWRLSLGSVALPFGLNLVILPDVLDAFVKRSDRFFPDPVYGFSAAYQDLMGAQFEFGQGDISDLKGITPTQKNKIFSVRATKDISALNGVRFAVSGLQAPNDDRRLSVGMFNVSRTHALTGIEWVRQGKGIAGVLNKSDQLIRFQYADDSAAEKRWLFEYEDEFINYWLTSIGYEKHYLHVVKTTLSTIVSYYKSRDPAQHSHMIITLGYGGEL